MQFAYSIILSAALLTAFPFVIIRFAFDSGFRKEMWARHKGGSDLQPAPGCLWLHASSVGEVRAAQLLIRALKQEDDAAPIVLSTFTRTGFELAQKESGVPVFRLPFDHPLWLKPLLDKLQPSILVLIEAELWPSLLGVLKQRKVPVLLANGRMSETSRSRYAAVRPFFQWLAGAVTHFSMRSKIDADRLRSLGVDDEKISVTGNVKFDAQSDPECAHAVKDVSATAPWLVCGSTRPGDEGPILDAVLKLRESVPSLNVVIAPRHLERCQEVEQLIADYNVEYALHTNTQADANGKEGTLILLNTLGALNSFYARAAVAFVGGGFNPRFGGHNILEPAGFGLPVVYGRHMNNFEEEARLLREAGGGIQIERPEQLETVLQKLLTDPDERMRRGRLARETVEKNRGAVKKNIEWIRKLRRSISNTAPEHRA